MRHGCTGVLVSFGVVWCRDGERKLHASLAQDPTSLVLALDATFGRLYRVRLDAVVCVLDADLLCGGLRAATAAAAAAAATARAPHDDGEVAVATAPTVPTPSLDALMSLLPTLAPRAQLAVADTVVLNKVRPATTACPDSCAHTAHVSVCVRERESTRLD